jgi:uncharacterized protein (TIGR00251 family)
VPRSSREAFGEVLGDRLKVYLCAPPVDGEANDALIRFFAKVFAVPRGSISVSAGERGRKKTVHIASKNCDEVVAVVEASTSSR